MLDPQELSRLFHNLEADHVERTRSSTDSDKIGEAICAFSNDLADRRQTGVLFVGQRDDGACAGLEITDRVLQNLAAFRSDGNIQPLPVMSVYKHTVDGCTLAVIEVEPSDNPPVRYKGRVCVRVGPRRGLATAEEERRLTEKRRWGNLPFDQHGVRGATLKDLDLDRLRRGREYLPAIVPKEVLEQNGRDEQDQMRALRLLTPEGTPTNAAILLLGVDPRQWLPGAYIQFVRYDGMKITDPIKDEKEISGPLADQLRLIDEVMSANIAAAIDPRAAVAAVRPNFPIVAMRELVRNAVLHRTYEGSAAPVHLYWYADRIEIQNPGGPYGRVTVANFGRPGVADYRNPALAEAAKALGFMHRFGSGIPRAQEELEKNGNPPATFTVEPTHIYLTIRPLS